MPGDHLILQGNPSLANELISFRNNLRQVVDKAEYLKGVMEKCHDGNNFTAIEEAFGIPPNGIQTGTESNGYKVLAWMADVDALFKSNADPNARPAVNDPIQPHERVKERIEKIIFNLA